MVRFLDNLVEKRRAALVLVALGAALLVPLLGHDGLWDAEVKVADLAHALIARGGAQYTGRPVGLTFLVAAGFKWFGEGALGGRIPVALASLVALGACFYAGASLVRRRAALLGGLALATMPVFFLGGRMLATDVLPILGSALAVGGFARAAWPRNATDEKFRVVHMAIGVAGALVGHFALGAALGVVLPVIAIAVALAVADGKEQRTVKIVWCIAAIVGVLVVVAAWAAALWGKGPAGYSQTLGGLVRNSAWSVNLGNQLKRIGFGAYPWIVLVPLAAIAALRSVGTAAADEADARDRFGRVVLVAWAFAGYVGATLYEASIGEILYPSFAALALLAGDYLDRALDDDAPLGYAAMLAAIGALAIAHDALIEPEQLVAAHLLDPIKWPPLPLPPKVIMGLGAAWAIAILLALALRPRRDLLSRGTFVGGALAVAVAQAAVLVFWVVPYASRTSLSSKEILAKFQELGGGEELGEFHVRDNGLKYSWKGKTVELGSMPQLFEYLGKPQRVFVMVGAEDLAALDQYAKQKTSPTGTPTAGPPAYYVVDDSNVHILLLSNQLPPGKKDLNPLRRLVVTELPPHGPNFHEAHADWEGKIELVGYDLPPEMDRGRATTITLYYKVKAPVGGGYKVFIHFDGPGTRFNGDHVPLDGKFPTNYWVPGYYIVDEHVVQPDRSSPAGNYTILTGFWLGSERLKVVAGNNDGDNRVKIGNVRVK